MESVESTSSVIPLMVSFHFDRWRISLKNRPSGSSGWASISPLRFETRNVEPSRMLILLSLIEDSPPLCDDCPTALCPQFVRGWQGRTHQSVFWTPSNKRRVAARRETDQSRPGSWETHQEIRPQHPVLSKFLRALASKY